MLTTSPKTLLLSAIYNKIWLFGGHDKDTDVVEVFDTIKGTGIHEPDVRSTMIRTTYNSTFRSVNPWKGVSFDTNIYFNSTQGMKYPSSVIINLP